MSIFKLQIIALALLLVLSACSSPTTTKNVIAQLQGEHCRYGADCSTHWSWLQRLQTRQPEYRCKMMAAACLAQTRNNEALEALKIARERTPQSVDTGDGIIYPGSCFSLAISAIKDHSLAAEQALETCSH